MDSTDVLYAQSYTEVVTILNCLPKNDLAKIPKQKLDFYLEKMDRNYNYTLDNNKSFAEQKMLPITEAILAILYRDYLADEGEKQKILKQDKLDWNILEDKKREKYNPDNLFKKSEAKIETVQNNVAITQYKESIFTKIKNWIKHFFNK